MAAKSSSTAVEIDVMEIHQGQLDIRIVGKSPLVFNRMAEKAKRELLLPKGRKTAADKIANLKHYPVQEYRDSVYRHAGDPADLKTRLRFPAPGFKGAMATAALEIPGARKAQIGRLVWVEGTHVDIYGVPSLYMAVVRSADMNHTPDIRTRAALKEWACTVSVRYAQPQITPKIIINLMAAAGLVVGVGDGRQEKGKLSFGQFYVVSEGEKTEDDFNRIVAEGGVDAQDAALADYPTFDEESQELLGWYDAEIIRLGRKEAA